MKLRLLQIFSISFGLLLVLFSFATPAMAAKDKTDLQAIITNTEYFKSVGGCRIGAGSHGTGDSKSGSWDSGLQPPYILEQFMIELLRDIAAKTNAPQSSTLTQEHVVALLGFAFGEGGDITNTSIFNPFNNGINAPDLVDGTHKGNGVQSFKSFDAGVEATARRMVEPGYSRLIDTLTNPSSTAEDFAYALTYYNRFPDNVIWAEASQPPHQDEYYNRQLDFIRQVRSDYKKIAGIQIGTPEKDYILHKSHPELVQFNGTGSAGSGGKSTCACAPGDVNTACSLPNGNALAILQYALLFSWPDNRGLAKKPEYQAAMSKYNPGIPFGGATSREGGADCGGFVATVLRASGADPNYPAAGTGQQEAYVRSHPEKYDIAESVATTADLQPGDILIVNRGSGSGADGHTYIYVGPQPNGTNEASASFHTRMANLGHAVLSDSRGNYMRARLK